MRILVTFAVDAEFAPWRKRYKFAPNPIELPHRYFKESFFTTTIGETDVTVYLTGIGWTVAPYGLRMLLEKRPDFCISSGLAGGLKRNLNKSDIVAARFVSAMDGEGSIGANSRLLELAVECGAKPVEKCITSRQILGQAQFKSAMSEFGDVVEMESFKIMKMATGPQIPAITIRSISDTVDEDLPLDFSQILDQSGKIRIRQLALQLGRHPNRIPALIRFGSGSQRAAEKLSSFLDRYIATAEKEFSKAIPDRRERVTA